MRFLFDPSIAYNIVLQGPWEPLTDLVELVTVVKSFSRDKKTVVEQIGLGCLLVLNTKTVRKTMCKWVIDHFNPETKELTVYGKTTEITPRHVEYLLGFSNSGYDVVEVPHDEEKMNIEARWLLSMDTSAMAVELRKPLVDVDKFKKIFTLFVLTALCSGTRDKKPKKQWIHVVALDESFIQHNFAKFILDSTVTAVAEFKSTESPGVLGGCPLLLMVKFLQFSYYVND